MTLSFKNWLNEMAFDLSTVDDPFRDPEFKKSLGNRKILLYHGTSTSHFWSILKNGFQYDPNRINWEKVGPGNYFAFTHDGGFGVGAGMYTVAAVRKAGGDGIIFVLEVPMSLLEPDTDDRESWDKDRFQQTKTSKDVSPKYITGVMYPADSKVETPIRKFINLVNKGKIPSIPPAEDRIVTRFSSATPMEEEEKVLDYLADILVYTSFDEYLYHGNFYKFRRIVLQKLLQPNLLRTAIYNWKADDWVKFIQDEISPLMEPDGKIKINTEEEYKTQPLANKTLATIGLKGRLLDVRYGDMPGFRQFRLGKVR